YPGRWTTPTIILLFALLTAFITCINVPLSAYEFIQEVTFRPNDTLPALPFSRWLPSLFQPPTISFQPQALTVGDTLLLNNSAVNFTLTGVYDRMNGGTPVSTFSYFNNPFSDECDIVCGSLFAKLSQPDRNKSYDIDDFLDTTGQPADNPSLFVPFYPNMIWDPADVSTIIQNMFQMMFHYVRLQMGVVHPNLIYASPDMYNRSILPLGPPPAELDSDDSDGEYDYFSPFNRSRAAMANETYFSQMLEIVHLFNTSGGVPVMEYSRTVPKLKPLGSAITSVFVSTFAMLSTIWAIFSLIAGALAKMYPDRRENKRGKDSLRDDADVYFGVEEQALSEHSRFLNDSASDTLQDEMELMKNRMKLVESYVRQMQLAFRRRGVSEEEIIGQY
ncbi:hypothetical protein R3P38DRAFT_3485309, partial [Favolaschia claudopus]